MIGWNPRGTFWCPSEEESRGSWRPGLILPQPQKLQVCGFPPPGQGDSRKLIWPVSVFYFWNDLSLLLKFHRNTICFYTKFSLLFFFYLPLQESQREYFEMGLNLRQFVIFVSCWIPIPPRYASAQQSGCGGFSCWGNIFLLCWKKVKITVILRVSNTTILHHMLKWTWSLLARSQPQLSSSPCLMWRRTSPVSSL